MLRKLTTEEKTLTEKGIAKREKEKTEAGLSLEVFKKQEEFLVKKRKFEDLQSEYEEFLKPYNRIQQDKQIELAISKAESDLRIAINDIDRLKTQLNKGVTEKHPGA